MALPVSTPTRLIAGDSASWLITLADYPAPTWVLTYRLVKDLQRVTITSERYESTGSHLASISANDSADIVPGTYSYQAAVTDGTDRYTVETGTIVVVSDFSRQSTGLDTRSTAVAALENIEAVIKIRTTQPHLEYTIKDRQMKLMPIPELLDVRDRLKNEVAAEQARFRRRKTGGSLFKNAYVRFR